MRTLYLECNMGAAGDMLMAGLLEIHPDAKGFVDKFNHLGIPKVKLQMNQTSKCGITGTQMSVMIDGTEEDSHHGEHSSFGENMKEEEHCSDFSSDSGHIHHHKTHTGPAKEHFHTNLSRVTDLIENLNISKEIKEDAICVYEKIAQAESNAHGKPVSEIHFHEVGTMDAVADVVGVCMLIHDIAPDKIVASPVHVGSGSVRCAHGILPVPAPATAFILKDIPIYGGGIRGELCTPTGAALLKHFVDEFSDMPVMRVEKIGYGMGKKDFSVANCIRVMLGETEWKKNEIQKMDEVLELCCNLDDMTPEDIGFATELLLKEGALDVYTTAVYMKKNRPGILLSCLCDMEERQKFIQLILKHTTTLGIREYTCKRYGLERNCSVRDTVLGKVRVKTASGYGVKKEKAEYEDLAEIARKESISLEDVRKKIEKEG